MSFPKTLTLICLSLLGVQLLPSASSPTAPQPVFAQSSPGAKSLFNLPVNSKPARSQGAASRGCDRPEVTNSELTLLVPSREFVAQTVSARPSFFWTVSHPVSVPLKFTLNRQGANEPLYEKQVLAPKAGIVAVELPADRPELVPGQLYFWTVTLLCNEKRPSANPFYSSWVERVAPSPELNAAVAQAVDERDRALAYARSGAWHDALAAFDRARSVQPDHPQIDADFNALLTSVGLQGRAIAFR